MWRRWILLALVVVLLSGCAGYERITVPPKIDLGGARSLAILFFDNYTDDYGLSYAVEQQLQRRLSKNYRVLEPAEAEWALARLKLPRGVMPTADQAVRLGKLLEVDALVVGEVSAYFAPVTQHPPYISKTRIVDDGKREHQWEISQTTIVMVGFTGRVMSTRTGNILYLDRVQGEATKVRKDPLGKKWYPEGEEPDRFFIPRLSTADIPPTRAAAINQAVDQFSADLLPTSAWRRIKD